MQNNSETGADNEYFTLLNNYSGSRGLDADYAENCRFTFVSSVYHILCRLGKKSLEGVNTLGGLGAAIGAFDEDTNEEFMVKRGPSAFTPRIGRAAFTPRIGRADPSTGQVNWKRYVCHS